MHRGSHWDELQAAPAWPHLPGRPRLCELLYDRQNVLPAMSHETHVQMKKVWLHSIKDSRGPISKATG